MAKRRRWISSTAPKAVDGAGVCGAASAGAQWPDLQDFDYYEIHEAFAAQVLCTLKAWEDPDYCKTRWAGCAAGFIDRSRLNVKGSSLAAGHPFAATGGRIVANLAKLLDAAGKGGG
jgi:acetyl-CoA C-acetyltransferase